MLFLSGGHIMELEFKSSKIKKQCEDPSVAQKDFGAKIGLKLAQRVRELEAAICLQDVKCIKPARLHRLEGKRQHQYAVDLEHPFRLVFEPYLDEGVEIFELSKINVVKIEEVLDYHGKKNRK